MHLILGWALPCLDDGFHRPGLALVVPLLVPVQVTLSPTLNPILRFALFCLKVALLMRERGSHADVPSSSGMFGGNRR